MKTLILVFGLSALVVCVQSSKLTLSITVAPTEAVIKEATATGAPVPTPFVIKVEIEVGPENWAHSERGKKIGALIFTEVNFWAAAKPNQALDWTKWQVTEVTGSMTREGKKGATLGGILPCFLATDTEPYKNTRELGQKADATPIYFLTPEQAASIKKQNCFVWIEYTSFDYE